MLYSIHWKVLDYPQHIQPCHHVVSMHVAPQESTKGCIFVSDEDIKPVVVQWFQQQQPTEFFVEQIYQLVYQQDACLNTYFNYFYSFMQNNFKRGFI
jgi:hypothetical protein